jgi:D-beta-D-heptose 7-phosphate kinase / D-beta-D-heptose 1-phosphate adenosyltransferase
MTDSTSNYPEIINSFTGKNILVIGDLILDIYLKGISTRLSPEAPVPVVDVGDRTPLLGGSANTVCNLRALGANVTYCTVLGNDREGDEAIALLGQLGVSADLILRYDARKTISKTRIVSGTHVVTRFDQGTTTPIEDDLTASLIDKITIAYSTADAVVLSDYDKGTITRRVIEALMSLQSRVPKFIAIDSKRLAFFRDLHPHFAKPNYEEVLTLIQLERQVTNRPEQIQNASMDLYDRINADLIAVTLDTEGSVIIETGQPVYRAVAPQISNPFISGAGDTYLSAFLLAYIVSSDAMKSAEIANAAATIAVKKEFTSSCSSTELKSYFNVRHKLVATLDDLSSICEAYRAEGKRIVFTNGCFDILHSGHVTYLHCARELGDVLIVGINSDESIRRIKGDSRPINGLADRVQVISALTAVNHIIPFGSVEDDTPVPVIHVVKPDFFAKGGDYNKEKLPEAATVEQYGGQIVFLPHIPDHSTTEIIKRISSAATSDQAIFNN